MAKINEARYIINESASMLARRKGANIIAVVIMGFSLLVLLIFILVTLNLSMVIESASEEMRVYVYLRDGLGSGDMERIRMDLLDLEPVSNVVFVSKKEAMEEFRKRLGNGSGLLEELDSNPLPKSFKVELKAKYAGSEHMEKVAVKASGWKGVEDVRYGKEWVERGERLVKGFYMTDLALGGIVLISVVFVISNTVRLSIVSRKKSIDIMKLVGATNSYIQVPFIIEGAVQGVVSALFAAGMLWLACSFARRYLPGLTFFRFEGVVGLVVLCALLGAAGSFVAIRRFLKR